MNHKNDTRSRFLPPHRDCFYQLVYTPYWWKSTRIRWIDQTFHKVNYGFDSGAFLWGSANHCATASEQLPITGVSLCYDCLIAAACAHDRVGCTLPRWSWSIWTFLKEHQSNCNIAEKEMFSAWIRNSFHHPLDHFPVWSSAARDCACIITPNVSFIINQIFIRLCAGLQNCSRTAGVCSVIQPKNVIIFSWWKTCSFSLAGQ